MENSNNSTSENNSNQSSDLAGLVKFDFAWIIGRIQEIILNPVGCWTTIKNEAMPAKELYGRYLIPLVLISAISSLIGQSVIGISHPFGKYHAPFFGTLIFSLIIALGTLGMFYVSSLIIEKLAPKFETSVSVDQALRLIGFAATPGLVAGILNIAPGTTLLTLIAAALGIYGIYVYWSGFQPMTGVSDKNKIAFFITTSVCSIVAYLVVFAILGTIFAPSPPDDLVNMKELRENIEKLIPGAN